jgi:hypothetical protein
MLAGGAAFFRHERRLAGRKPITSMSMSTHLCIRYSVAGEQEHEEGEGEGEGEEETGKTSNVEASFALSVIEGIEPRKRVRLTRLNFFENG